MNDRFKFRVWDNNKKEYLDKGYIHRKGYLVMPTMKNDYSLAEAEGDFVIEQCTGLKDKNGKLIYEWDIVELTQARNKGWMQRGTKLVVEYNTDRYCGFGFDGGYALTEKCAKNCIVIGNIHERGSK